MTLEVPQLIFQSYSDAKITTSLWVNPTYLQKQKLQKRNFTLNYTARNVVYSSNH